MVKTAKPALKDITVTLIRHAIPVPALKLTKTLLADVMSLNKASSATAEKATPVRFVTDVTKDISGIPTMSMDFVKAVTATLRESCQMNATNSTVSATVNLVSLEGVATSVSCLVIFSSIIVVSVS